MTESELRPPKARLARLGPILMPLVMPPKPAEIALAMPRRTSRRSSPARSSPGWLASLAHSSASIEAMTASASAPDTITSARMLQRLGHRQPGKIDQHGAHRRTRRQRPDHRAQHVAETDQREAIISDDAAAEADQHRRHPGRKPARVPHRREGQRGDQQAQRPRLTDRAEARWVKRMLCSKPSTLPSCTRNSSTAAMFWKPAITGCGANLINEPSRNRPNSA